jgi:hypothetical protein
MRAEQGMRSGAWPCGDLQGNSLAPVSCRRALGANDAYRRTLNHQSMGDRQNERERGKRTRVVVRPALALVESEGNRDAKEACWLMEIG